METHNNINDSRHNLSGVRYAEQQRQQMLLLQDNSNVVTTPTTFHDTMIYLNNTAVTILGKYNDFKTAIEIMKGAFELLKVSKASTLSTTTTSNDIELCRKQAVQLASERMNQKQTQQNQYSRTVEPTFLPVLNDIGVVVIRTNESPNSAYHLLASIRTSKAALYITTKPSWTDNDGVNTNRMNVTNDNDDSSNLHVVQSILVYNYGIAHRCCVLPSRSTSTVSSSDNLAIDQKNNKIGTFCLQIFQYAEQLLLPIIKERQQKYDVEMLQDRQSEGQHSRKTDVLLLYRFLLTRNLMMTSCKLGMSLCELYKQTLDPIENEILFMNDAMYSNTTILMENVDNAQQLSSPTNDTIIEINTNHHRSNNQNGNNNASAA